MTSAPPPTATSLPPDASRALVHVAADGPGTGASHGPVEVFLVRARALASRRLVVAPRAAERPSSGVAHRRHPRRSDGWGPRNSSPPVPALGIRGPPSRWGCEGVEGPDLLRQLELPGVHPRRYRAIAIGANTSTITADQIT